jgi:hypothetical protein
MTIAVQAGDYEIFYVIFTTVHLRLLMLDGWDGVARVRE